MRTTKSLGPHDGRPIAMTGVDLDKASTAMILIHGRGATAHNILDLARVFKLPDTTYLAPEATNNSWYPDRFIAPIAKNEPYLSSALEVIQNLVFEINAAGVASNRIILGGFSQGACLSSEFVARNPMRYGALLAFSGGLIGPPGALFDYHGDLQETPVFLGCDANDFHIPVERVHETDSILTRLGARVTKRIYTDIGHTIVPAEMREAQRLLQSI